MAYAASPNGCLPTTSTEGVKKATGPAQGNAPAIGDVVMVRTEERNRGKWPLGIVEDLIVGTDGVVKGAILRPGKSRIERQSNICI